ncbi:hypothetical protein M378DRAFT_59515, partial [Amanita muscaria Koide BX008]
ENLVEAVWSTLELYGITDKIIAFVMDNASNNDTMIEHVETRCHQKGIPFSAKHARGRCMPHTIHLAAIIVSSSMLVVMTICADMMQLLEESGAISSSDARTASQFVNYQES